MTQEHTRGLTMWRSECSNRAHTLEKCLIPRVIPDLIEEVNAHVTLCV